ncbi:MAG: TIGR03936 family radical SAM-associated protein [Clostridia bacterium]|nr:TIGR03936 family radical SAM-associated protein [Clostridia bacterium]
MREVRLEYTKLGNTKYISHLDLNRVFFRAVRRAEIPLWFTEGYNPKPYFKYAQSLPLGVESECECVDIRLTDDNYSNSLLKEKLNAVLPEGIRILRVHEPKMKANDIYAAVYEIAYEVEHPESVIKKMDTVLSGDALYVTKKVKHGRKKSDEDVDILPNVITYAFEQKENILLLKILATAEQNNTLNVFLFAGALEKKADFDYAMRNIRKRCVVNENYRYFK